MTNSQEKALNKIKRLAEKWANDGFKDGELKEWNVEEDEYFVSVVVEIGGKNDEGTWAEVVCRDRAQLFIGKCGGVTYPVHKRLKNGTFKHYTKTFKGYSILQAVVDQR